MPPLGFKFSLEEKYELGPALPRSYFNILQQWNLPHTIVFDWPEPDHIFFKEIAGMRKSTYISILEQNSGEFWELHLKPTKERTNILGYLCRGSDIQRDIQSRAEALLRGRKLPLVLDLDDTLVRVVGNEPGRYVSEADAQTVPQRVVQLKDGRRVVLADRVHEFLEWAQRLFEISVCSLGDQSYVDMVVQVLDPHRTRIRGILYSARAEYVHIQGSSNQKRPPKDLLSLFAYCSPPLVRIESDRSLVMPVEPLIVDDNSAMWPPEQRDNIIVVREMKNSPVWNVSLFGVVDNVLSSVYNEFFKQYDVWMQLQKNEDTNSTPPPSVVSCYKEYLRYELSMKIAT
ncbi:uncharacterized protein BJ171DRAFT_425749 [Polychytrium aggregatum]|uniref:uncharacterized protein n=1 Tax=Polychytrium aggregatum TaxID=110093 RepID=UPI0022FDC89E|nr:uncharacterized protein BJ171DRAFT_425749 [Polychytrium aggregatum]KAI9203086.1 hypothetical protein BJ171DRAFT_425749 [Polychytrium aggregatum]